MNKQSDQKVSHEIHSKFREFFPGDQVLVEDIRTDETWWPMTVAERTMPKSYIVILSDSSESSGTEVVQADESPKETHIIDLDQYMNVNTLAL